MSRRQRTCRKEGRGVRVHAEEQVLPAEVLAVRAHARTRMPAPDQYRGKGLSRLKIKSPKVACKFICVENEKKSIKMFRFRGWRGPQTATGGDLAAIVRVTGWHVPGAGALTRSRVTRGIFRGGPPLPPRPPEPLPDSSAPFTAPDRSPGHSSR